MILPHSSPPPAMHAAPRTWKDRRSSPGSGARELSRSSRASGGCWEGCWLGEGLARGGGEAAPGRVAPSSSASSNSALTDWYEGRMPPRMLPSRDDKPLGG